MTTVTPDSKGKKWHPTAAKLFAVLFIALIVVLASATFSRSQTNSEQPTTEEKIRIVSPAEGTTFSPGETITVVVEPGADTSFEIVIVGFKGAFFLSGTDESSPFEIPVIMPDVLGPATIQAFGRDQSGKVFSAEVTINLQTQATLQKLEILSAPDEFNYLPNESSIFVQGHYSDGRSYDITEPQFGTTYRTFSKTLNVVEVTPDGKVIGRGEGTDTIIVENSGVSIGIPITVEITNLHPRFTTTLSKTITALVGELNEVPLAATDPDGDKFFFPTQYLPSFVDIQNNNDGTAVLRLTPSIGDVGTYVDERIHVFDFGTPRLGDTQVVTIEVRLPVSIDIKPGSDPNCFNNDGKGTIPVAILSSATFDATQVDPSTVLLDGQGVRIVGNGKTQAYEEDVNEDGINDLVVQIEDTDGTYAEGSTAAILTGITFDEVLIQGTDTICVVP